MSLANAQAPELAVAGKKSATRAWPLLAAGVLAAIYLVTSIVIAAHRLLWYDEIFAVTISRLPSLSAIWEAMAHASDLLPPTYYMLLRLFEQPIGAAEIGARLPSALAMVAGMLVTFDCARRLTDGLHGLIAFGVLACSTLPYYGYEARPYSLFFLLSSLALWIWIHGPRGKLSAVLFGTAIFLAMLVHYYAVLCLVPYAVWEFFADKTWRMPSPKLMAGCIGVFCALALFFRQIQALRQIAGSFWATPTPAGLAALFTDYFPYGGLLITGAVVWVALAGRKKGSSVVPAMFPAERLGWFFTLIPLAGYGLAVLVTHGFYPRYFIGLLPGIAVAASCLMWRYFSHTPRVSVGVLLLLLLIGLGQQFSTVQHPERIDPWGGQQTKTKAMMRLEPSLELSGKQYIVLPANGLLSVEAHYYARHPERFVFLIDPNPNSTATVLMNLGQRTGLRFWTVSELAAHRKDAVLIEPSRELLNALQREGLRANGYFDEGLEVVNLD